jgi:hypothetical protein
MKRSFLALPLVSLLALGVGCSTASDTADDTESAATTQGKIGCPVALIEHNVRASRGPGLWEVDEQDCFSIGKSTFPSPASFEIYLSNNSHSSLGYEGSAKVSQCLVNYMSANTSQRNYFYDLSNEKQDYIERAAISDYYYAMNTMRQATRGTLEAIAGLDQTLGWTPVLAESPRDANEKVYKPRYTSPLAVDSEKWTRELRACPGAEHAPFSLLLTETRDNLVLLLTNRIIANLLDRDITNLNPGSTFDEPGAPTIDREVDVWYKTWAGRPSKRFAGDTTDLEADKKVLDAQFEGHKNALPWINGKHMTQWLEPYGALDIQKGGIIRSDGMLEFRKLNPEGIAKEVAKRLDAKLAGGKEGFLNMDLKKQLRENRKLLTEKLEELYAAAECLHRPGASSCMPKVNDVMASWPNFDGTGFKAENLPEDDEVLERLRERTDEKSKALVERLIERKTKQNASMAGMFAAECRTQVRTENGKIAEARRTLVQSIAITVVTMGVGSWLTASKAALAAARVAATAEATATAANAAQIAALAQRVVALNGVLLAADGYWLGEAVVSSMKSCNKYINHNLFAPVVSPLGESAPYCRRGEEALGSNDVKAAATPTAVADYRACAFDASINVLLNTLGILPSAIGFKNAVKAKT